MSTSKAQASSFPEINFYGGVRRACDACRKKKIRCDAQQPCGVCRKAGLRCLYEYVPRKKGPKGARTKPSGTETDGGSGTVPIQQTPNASSPPQQSNSPQYQSPPTYQQYQPSPTSSVSLNSIQSPGINGPYATFDFQDVHGYRPEQPGQSPGSYASSHPSNPRSDGSTTHPPSPLSNHPAYPSILNHGMETFNAQVPGHVLRPFIELFFQQMFPIMPVLERELYLDSDLLQRHGPMATEQYALVTALSAVSIVQLNLPAEFVQQTSAGLSAEVLVEQCLRERQRSDYIDNPRTTTVLTSFFLFCYYGHLEKHNKALHYLHESISFAECINLDDEASLSECNFREGQWRRRIFWLLFVTERAYALQRQNRVKIQNISIHLPAVFESEEPRLLYGFVNLVNLFRAIDGTFLAAWKGQKSLPCTKDWLVQVQKKLDASASAMIMFGDGSETQQLDIKISRQWLHVLAWQISVKHGLLSLGAEEEPFNLNYPIQLARDLVETTSSASQSSLDSHGIGMEQKIADIAGCLTDVLKCAEGDMSEPFRQGRDYLTALLRQLSNMRGVQSRYLEPLLMKSDTLINQLFSPMSILPQGGFEIQPFHGGVIENEYDYDL